MTKKCKKCPEFYIHYKSNCSMGCSKKGRNKKYPEKLNIYQFRKCLENNTGLPISVNVYKYVKEIELALAGVL